MSTLRLGGSLERALAIWAFLLIPIAANAQVVVSYQKGDGKGSVSETDDTTIDEVVPDTTWVDNGQDITHIEVDQSDHRHTVLKFPNIFGGGTDQIPLGSLIVSATLTLVLDNDGTDCPIVYQLKEDWTESEATWNSRSTGISWSDPGADGSGSNTGVVVGVMPCTGSIAPVDLDVTTTLQNWSDGDLNAGWVFVNDANNDGINYRSSEHGTAGDRPLLTVTYLPQVFYSVGTNAADLKTGSPSITIAGGIATLDVAQTNHIGVGDVIDHDTDNKLVYIYEVISPTQFRVQTSTGGTPTGVSSVNVNSIKRAFNSVASAVTNSAALIGNSDLTAIGRRLTWVCYNDGAFNVSSTTSINGYTTDATHFITLTVAGASQVATAVSQRHTGVAGTGVRFEASGGGGMTFLSVAEAFTRIEWVELDGNDIATAEGILLQTSADNSLVQNVIVHHLDGTPGSETVTSSGIYIDSGNDASEVRNSIVYAYDGDGVHVSGSNAVVANSTFYLGRTNPSSNSVQTDTGATASVYNVLGVGPETDFWENNAPGIDLYNCISEDNSAQTFDVSGNFKTGVNETSEFVSITGAINLHLRAGAQAINFGTDLSASFTTDIDDESRPQGSAWDVGADETPWSSATIRYSSIGINAGNLHAVGMASVPIGSTTVTFTSPLPAQTAVGAVGTGDVLDIQGETLFIEAYNSPTQVTLQSAATVDHSTPTSTFTITRAFNSLQAWENARGGNLVGEDRMEIGVAYKDGPFAELLSIDGSTTDSTHFMHLTVAVGQRHDGTAETGVVLDGQSADRMGIEVLDDYTVVEWFDLKNHHGPTGYPGIRVEAATNVLFQFLLVRDFYDATGNSEGIAMRQGQVNGMTVRNCIIFNGDAVGIEGDDGDDTLVIENVTIYNMAENGIDEKNGTLISASNTISMGNGGIDFDMPSGTQSHNMSEDGTASCGTCKGTENPLIQFQAVGTDFHLAGTSTAIDAGTDLSGSFCCDIDAESRPGGAQWDMGADEFGAVTAVELASFEATAGDRGVELTWATASELNNLGFHLYRATVEAGPYERITTRMIPGLGSSPEGADYNYRDAGLTNGATYFYKLEDIDGSGARELHGPISATPGGGASSAEVDAATLITYGQPAANTFRVTERGPFGVTLELTTHGFYAEPLEDGTVRLEIPGFEALRETHGPSIPVKRAWVEAVAGRKVEIPSVSLLDVETFSSLKPADAEVSDLVASRDGTVRLRQRLRARRARGRGETLTQIGMYPAEAARLTSVGFQGDVKKALVELAPLRWDSATGRLVLARRLVVRLSFAERDSSESTRDGIHGKRRQRQPESTEGVVARLGTKDSGLYAVRFEDVFRHGGRAIEASTLRLSRQGEVVAYRLEPRPDRFGPGSTLYFVSEGAAANPYGKETLYELSLAPGGTIMEERDASPSGSTVGFYQNTVRREQNRYYQAGLVDAPDLWLWELISASETKGFSFQVSDLVSLGRAPRLRVWLQGASDLPAALDHHVRLYLNGSFVTETSWDGKLTELLDSDLPPGVLTEGENLLELENVGDTGAAYSMVMLDRFEVTHPRSLAASHGHLEGVFETSGVAKFSGLDSGAFLLDATGADPLWLEGATVGSDGIVRARVEAGRHYRVVDPNDILRPAVHRFRATGLRDENNAADYLLVAPEEFLPAASPLLELRAHEGLRVKAASMEDIASEFGFGEATPQALKRFLSYAYHEWEGPSPRYVVLLGDATYDFKDYLGTGVQNRVPPLMVETSYLWTASDPALAAVNGDDILPDLAIGRLPAASLAEARAIVDKILAYENGDTSITRGSIVLVADNPDGAGDFEADAEAIANTVLPQRDLRKLYLRTLGASATRSAILQAFDDGASLVNYIGHGGIHLWASENVFDIDDSEALTSQSQQPLLITMNCLNGYFHFPYFNSLAEELLKEEGKGAIAAFSPTGLSLDEPAHRYHQALIRALFSGEHDRLGDAVLEAQAVYAQSGAFPELLSIYHLLGDPALVLR